MAARRREGQVVGKKRDTSGSQEERGLGSRDEEGYGWQPEGETARWYRQKGVQREGVSRWCRD